MVKPVDNYQIGDVVLYETNYYECKQVIYNYNGLPTALTQYWELMTIEEGVKTDVPEGFGWKRINEEISMGYNSENKDDIFLMNGIQVQ